MLNHSFCVLFGRKLLHRTSSAGKPRRSKFMFDVDRKRLYMKTDLSDWKLCRNRMKVDGGQRRERRDGDRGRGPRERGRGRGRLEFIQSHSIFEQGPAEMMMKKRSKSLAGWELAPHCWLWLRFFFFFPVSRTGGFESEREAPSVGPSPIINIKKEKRETEEETKEILRSLERDNASLSDVTHPH